MKSKSLTIGTFIIILCLTCEGPDIAVDSEGKIIEQQEEMSCACRVNGDVGQSGDGQSWETAMKTVQECIDVIESESMDSGCEIWVKRGTVVEGYDFDSTKLDPVELRPDIRAFGGFKGTEITKNERIWNAVRAISKSDMDRDTFSDRQNLFNSYVQSHPELLDDFHHSVVPSPGNLPDSMIDVPDPELMGFFQFPCLCDRFFGQFNEQGGAVRINSYGGLNGILFARMVLSGTQIDTSPTMLILNGLTENGVTVVGPYNEMGGKGGALIVRKSLTSATKLSIDNNSITSDHDTLFLNWHSKNDVILANPTGGRVGIGTEEMDYNARLQVEGEDTSSNMRRTTLRISSGAQEMYIDGNEIDSNEKIYINHNSENEIELGGFVTAKNHVVMERNVGIEGNVGIGTDNLDYKLNVNGTIKAKKIILQTGGWSDFVFYDDYDLMNLEDVEDYINKEGHLPGIPSADEVHSNGVSVGDTQAKLLQKIEEMTLYLIKQKKEIDELKARMNKHCRQE